MKAAAVSLSLMGSVQKHKRQIGRASFDIRFPFLVYLIYLKSFFMRISFSISIVTKSEAAMFSSMLV